MTDTDVLELSAILPDRTRARLRTNENPEGLRPDGSEYELVNPEEFGLVDIRGFTADFKRMSDLWDGARGETEQQELAHLLDGMACRLLDGPADEVVKLPPIMKRGVVLRFFIGLNSRQLVALGSEGTDLVNRIAKAQAA